VLLGDPVDHLLDDDGLADSGTPEHPDLPTLDVGLQEVDDLDARLEHLGLRLELFERGGLAVDGPAFDALGQLGTVYRLTEDVVDVPQRLGADRHGDRGAGVRNDCATHQTVGRLHADGSNGVVSDVGGDLGGDGVGLTLEGSVDGQREVDLGEPLRWELDVDDRAGDGEDASFTGPTFFACKTLLGDCHATSS
jgi:hypothetical protein